MSVAIGEWIGSGNTGTWPRADPGRQLMTRLWRVLTPAQAGVSFSEKAFWSQPSNQEVLATRSPRTSLRVVPASSLPVFAIEKIIGATAAQLAEEAGAGRILPEQVNQGDLEQLEELLAWCKAEKLDLTHVYPFAAINHPQVFFGIKAEDYQRVFGVNVFGVYHLCVKDRRQAPRRAPWYVVVPLSPNDGRLTASASTHPSKHCELWSFKDITKSASARTAPTPVSHRVDAAQR